VSHGTDRMQQKVHVAAGFFGRIALNRLGLRNSRANRAQEDSSVPANSRRAPRVPQILPSRGRELSRGTPPPINRCTRWHLRHSSGLVITVVMLPIDVENVVSYLHDQGWLNRGVPARAELLAWGVSNVVLRVTPETGPALVVKQS